MACGLVSLATILYADSQTTMDIGADVGAQIMLNVAGQASALQFNITNAEMKSTFLGNTAAYHIDAANDPAGVSVQGNSNNANGFTLVVYCSDDLRSVSSPTNVIPISQFLFSSTYGGQVQASLATSETAVYTKNTPGTVNDTMTFFSKVFSRDAALPDYQTMIYFVLKNL